LIGVVGGGYFLITGNYSLEGFGYVASPTEARAIGVLALGVGLGLVICTIARLMRRTPAVLIKDDTIQLHAWYSPAPVILRREDIRGVTRIFSLGVWPVRYKAFKVLTTTPNTPLKNNSPLVIDKCVELDLPKVRKIVISFKKGLDRAV
jgi:hypothetical protein